MTNYNMLTFTIDELESLGIGEVTAIDLANCGKESLVFVTKKWIGEEN